jgi:hypothetical protein
MNAPHSAVRAMINVMNYRELKQVEIIYAYILSKIETGTSIVLKNDI